MFRNVGRGSGVCVDAKSDPEHDLIEQLTLNQRATGSIPVRPTNTIKHLRRSCLDPVRGKTCYRSVSGSCAPELRTKYGASGDSSSSLSIRKRSYTRFSINYSRPKQSETLLFLSNGPLIPYQLLCPISCPLGPCWPFT